MQENVWKKLQDNNEWYKASTNATRKYQIFNVGDIVLIESVTEVLYKMVGNFDPSWGRTKQYAGMNTTYRVYAENGKVYREVDLKPITNNKHLKDLFKKYPKLN